MQRMEAFGLLDAAGFELLKLHDFDKVDLPPIDPATGKPKINPKTGKERKPIAKGKAPFETDWTKRPADNADALAYASKNPKANIGIRLTRRLLVVDVDPRNFEDGVDSLALLSADTGYDFSDHYPRQVTGSGGLHLFFKKPVDLDVAGTVAAYPGLEFKTAGTQVVGAGSIHPETRKPYTFEIDPFGDMQGGIEGLPDIASGTFSAFRNLIAKGNAPGAPGDVSGAQGMPSVPGQSGMFSDEQLERFLARLNPEDYRDYEKWFSLMGACHDATGGSGAGVFIAWSIQDDEYCDAGEEIGSKWGGLNSDKGNLSTFKSLFWALKAAGAGDVWERGDFEDMDAAAAQDFANADDDEASDDPTGVNAMIENGPVTSRKKIRLRDGYQDTIVAEATEALMEALGGQILQQNGGLVRPVVLDATQSVEGVVKFSAGMTVLLPVTTDWLWLKLSEEIRFYRMTQQTEEKGGELKATPADPPKKLAVLIQANIGRLPFYTVRALVTTPTIDVASGEVIDVPGINPRTGLLAVFEASEFPKVKRGLTQAEARERLDEVFHDLLRGFPFDDGERGASAAVAMSTLITPLLRATMKSAPLHAIDAAAPGTGKTMLSEISGTLATGTKPAASAWSRDEEENEKRLGAALMQKASVLLLDNLEAKKGDKLEGNMMCMVLTSEMVSIRVLGTHGKANLSTKTFIMATGNNIVVAGDMVRRVVKCRLDAKMARPETRSFNFVPTDLASERRGVIVASILEAVAAYIDAGRPCEDEVERLGGFENWTLVQGLLKWCGWEDPAMTIDAVRATDTSRHETEEALEVWHMAFGEDWVTPQDLVDLIVSAKAFDDLEELVDYEHFEAVKLMKDTLLEGKETTTWIGRIFGKMGGVACGEYYLEAEKGSRTSRARLRKG